MAKVTFVPYDQVIIHEIVQQDNSPFFEDIIRMTLTQPNPVEPTVNWIDGIAFLLIPMAGTEDIIRENLAGKIHFATVIFTKMQHRASVPVSLGNQQYTVRLRDNSINKIQSDVVGFLKSYQSNASLIDQT